MDEQHLQNEFLSGTVPDTLDGFYQGKIEYIEPENLTESFLTILCGFWSPWKGKYFYRNGKGDNVLSDILMWATRFWFRDLAENKSSDGKFHAFPFQTSVGQSLSGDRPVLRLDYNLEQNPPFIRSIIDELAWTADGSYLGVTYVKKADEYRLFLYFRLLSASAKS